MQISDFGLAKWLPDQWTHHIVSKIEGTFGFVIHIFIWISEFWKIFIFLTYNLILFSLVMTVIFHQSFSCMA